jgi:hypothetical protein
VSAAVTEFREELARRAKALQSWEEALDARYAEVEALGKATREREAAAAEQQQAAERRVAQLGARERELHAQLTETQRAIAAASDAAASAREAAAHEATALVQSARSEAQRVTAAAEAATAAAKAAAVAAAALRDGDLRERERALNERETAVALHEEVLERAIDLREQDARAATARSVLLAWRWAALERQRHAALAETHASHAAELGDLRARHDAELADLRARHQAGLRAAAEAGSASATAAAAHRATARREARRSRVLARLLAAQTKRQVRRAFDGLRAAARRSKRRRWAAEGALAKLRLQHMRCGWRTWRAIVSKRRRLARALRHMASRTVATAHAGWQAEVRERRRRRALLERAARRVGQRTAAGAFDVWHSLVIDLQWAASEAQKLTALEGRIASLAHATTASVGQSVRRLVKLVFTTWRLHVEAGLTRSAQAMRAENYLLRARLQRSEREIERQQQFDSDAAGRTASPSAESGHRTASYSRRTSSGGSLQSPPPAFVALRTVSGGSSARQSVDSDVAGASRLHGTRRSTSNDSSSCSPRLFRTTG